LGTEKADMTGDASAPEAITDAAGGPQQQHMLRSFSCLKPASCACLNLGCLLLLLLLLLLLPSPSLQASFSLRLARATGPQQQLTTRCGTN
jgi:hypothetical protein